LGLAGCGPIAPGRKRRYRGRDGRGPSKQTEITMPTIGTFTASENGFTGSIKTLTLNIRAKFVASEKDHEKAAESEKARLSGLKQGFDSPRERQFTRLSPLSLT
jgi:hypothetical protein